MNVGEGYGNGEGDGPPAEREPVTHDGEVEVKLDMGAVGNETNTVLADAVAAHFGVEPDALQGFVLSAEYKVEEGVTLSSAWSLGVPVWRLRSFAAELVRHLEGV